MALIWADRVLETSTTTGTGALTLAGTVTGYQAFSDVMASPSDTCYYSIWGVDAGETPTGEWETGLGTYSASNTLTRTTVLASSNSGSAVDFSAGTKRVALTQVAENIIASGASFPGSPSSGDRFYRTDLNMMAFYDGTRWLSDGPPLSINLSNEVSAQSATFDGVTVATYSQHSAYDLYVESVMHSIGISGTGNWTCEVQTSGGTSVSSKTVSASSFTLETVGSVVSSTPFFKLKGTENSGTATCTYRAAMNYRLILT